MAAQIVTRGEEEFKVLGGALLFKEDYDGVQRLVDAEVKAGRRLGFAEAVARYVRGLREGRRE